MQDVPSLFMQHVLKNECLFHRRTIRLHYIHKFKVNLLKKNLASQTDQKLAGIRPSGAGEALNSDATAVLELAFVDHISSILAVLGDNILRRELRCRSSQLLQAELTEPRHQRRRVHFVPAPILCISRKKNKKRVRTFAGK